MTGDGKLILNIGTLPTAFPRDYLMASIFKPTYTKIDPKTGNKRTLKAKKWYAQYKDQLGIVRRVPGYPDKEATRQLAATLERNAARELVGLSDPFEEHRKRPIAEHIED